MTKREFTKKTFKHGNSQAVVIPDHITKTENINPGDLLSFSVEKIEETRQDGATNQNKPTTQ